MACDKGAERIQETVVALEESNSERKKDLKC